MARSYKGVRLKIQRVYSVADLRDAYKVTAKTVSNWVQGGLTPSDGLTPYVFRGAEVTAFHEDRRKRSRRELRPGEFKCQSCKMAIQPEPETVSVSRATRSGAPLLMPTCSDGGACVMKIGSIADLSVLGLGPDPNISGDRVHKENAAAPGGTGIRRKILSSANDRIIWKWQDYAGRYSENTKDRHLSAIRAFEQLTERKPFDQLTTNDLVGVREALKEMVQANAPDRKSKSTVQHMASHIKDFLLWLLKQDGYRRLPPDLSYYLALPKSIYAKALPSQRRKYADLEQAQSLLQSMPSYTLLEKRNRAIFAIAFLGALRADTLISLRLKHIDVAQRRIIQDGCTSRAKNGKSLTIALFPIPRAFEEAVRDWAMRLTEMGFEPDDALFPSSNCFDTGRRPAAFSD